METCTALKWLTVICNFHFFVQRSLDSFYEYSARELSVKISKQKYVCHHAVEHDFFSLTENTISMENLHPGIFTFTLRRLTAGVSVTHFAVALLTVVIAPCVVQRTVRLHVKWQWVSAGTMTPAIGGFGGSPPRKL